MQSSQLTIPAEQTTADIAHQYILIAWRNKLLIAGSMALSLALAGGYYLLATKYFQSQALVVVEERGIDNVINAGDSEEKFEQRLFLIQRQIVNRAFMSEVARELSLYQEGADEEVKSAAIGALLDMTKVERIKMDPSLGLSNQSLVEGFVVSFLHENPKTAMQVTERIAGKFIRDTNTERGKTVEGTGEFLEEELGLLKRELEKKEEHISQFKKLHLGGLPSQTDANMRSLDRAETDVTRTTEDLQRHSDKLAVLNQAVQQYRVSGQQSPGLVISRSMEPDPLFKRLRELREQLVKLRAEFWDGYPEVVLTKEEIRRIEEELVNLYGRDAIRPDKTQLDPYLQDLAKLQSEERTEIALLQRRLEQLHATKRDLEKRLEKSPVVEQELLVLERDYSSMKDNYSKLLDKRLHTLVQENVEKRQKGGKFRILDHANFPQAPAIPNKLKVLILGVLFGCVSGAGLTILRERLTPQFRGPEDVEILLAGPRLLASIPDFSSLWRMPGDSEPAQNSALPGRSLGMALRSRSEIVLNQRPLVERSGLHEIDRRFVTKVFPRSMAAEQYRVAAARLQLLNATGAPIVAAVTSAIKGEGKTTTVINLGYTLARDFGRRVLLVDCDFVFPELTAFIETPIGYGLIDCLKSDIPSEQAMSSFTDVPCWIMPAGQSVSNSTELLRAGQLGRVLSQLRDEFDYILLNAPPILPVATMNVLESHCDLHLLVVRANVTSKQVVKHALGSLRADKPIHVILNGVASSSLPSYMLDYSSGESRVAV
jgi:polysaccharide biosynthesis transport protein